MSDATTRFGNRVADYVRARPGYPPEVMTVLRRAIGLAPTWTVADVGAGTGIGAAMFLEAGCEVVAVEPNASMRSAIAPHPKLRLVAGTAEATTLGDASVNLVVAAQAFHWFDRDAFRRECARILRPGGHVAILFNDRLTTGTPFLDGYERLLERFGTDYASVNHRRIAEAEYAAFFAGGTYARHDFFHSQRFGFDGVRARLLSSSYAPAADDPRAPAMLDALRELFDATNVGGVVEMAYETQLSLGKVN